MCSNIVIDIILYYNYFCILIQKCCDIKKKKKSNKNGITTYVLKKNLLSYGSYLKPR